MRYGYKYICFYNFYLFKARLMMTPQQQDQAFSPGLDTRIYPTSGEIGKC